MSINIRKLLNDQRIRFALVGIINTLIDLVIYTLLYHPLGFIIANFISTSCGMVASYVLHRKYTFRVKTRANHKELATFFVITASGLWAFQPLIIYATTGTVQTILGSGVLVTLLPKFIAVCGGLVWNYIWYNRIVFRDKTNQSHNRN